MPTGLKGGQQELTPPQTRIMQAYQAAWTRYYGVAPRGLIRTRNVVLPAMRRLPARYKVKR